MLNPLLLVRVARTLAGGNGLSDDELAEVLGSLGLAASITEVTTRDQIPSLQPGGRVLKVELGDSVKGVRLATLLMILEPSLDRPAPPPKVSDEVLGNGNPQPVYNPA